MELVDETLTYKKPVELLQKLIQFDTVNPPGNESICTEYIETLLKSAGIETMLVGEYENRKNLIARLKGSGSAPPFLMYGHADVVGTEHQEWKYPPFEGKIAEGCIWGRGALDMKGALTMMICALLRLKAENIIPRGDIILAVLADEEDEGVHGGKYVVENYSHLFDGVKYAIGEIGGFTMHMGGKRFYPIMIAEKQKCSIRMTIKGEGGHGSMPMHDGAMAKLGKVLTTLNKKRLPVHITAPTKMMIEALGNQIPFPANAMLLSLLNPLLTNTVLNILGAKGRVFDPILHNTVNATIVNGGSKINVIPGEVVLQMDGRILPGLTTDDMFEELTELLGNEFEFETTCYQKGPSTVDMEMFNKLSQVLKEKDEHAIPIPFIVSGVTDARFFAQLGIQTYGFTPMTLPKELDFSRLIHSSNERIPIDALEFGVDSIFKLLKTL